MKIVVAGGSGLLGRSLTARLANDGHEVVSLTRATPSTGQPDARTRSVIWNPNGDAGPWAAELEAADAVVNLSGAGIADKRWTAARKRLLRTSRVLSTRSLIAAMRQCRVRPATFIQQTAIGYYGCSLSDQKIDESFPPGDDFLADLCVTWEAESRGAAALGCRLVVIRCGVVLTRDGGPVGKLRWPFLLFGGGPIASGQQYLSWIHLADWVALIVWALGEPSVSGEINGTSPNPVTNREFSRALGRALHRPAWLPMPAFALRIAVGEMADAALVNGQRVVPARAQKLGFRFQYPDLDPALRHVLA